VDELTSDGATLALGVGECQQPSDPEDQLPTYQYACTECGEQFEAVQSFSDPALTECPNCGGKLRKVFNSVGIVFKGSGFYRNDSRPSEVNADKSNGSETKSDSKTSESSSSSSDNGSSKPAAASSASTTSSSSGSGSGSSGSSSSGSSSSGSSGSGSSSSSSSGGAKAGAGSS
jgi:putative FmdB family regulatory protein